MKININRLRSSCAMECPKCRNENTHMEHGYLACTDCGWYEKEDDYPEKKAT